MGHVVVDIIIVLENKVFSLMKSTYITVYVLYFLEYWLNDNEMININVRHKMMFLIFLLCFTSILLSFFAANWNIS